MPRTHGTSPKYSNDYKSEIDKICYNNRLSHVSQSVCVRVTTDRVLWKNG